MVLLKCTISPLVIHSFHDYSWKDTFSFVSQINNANLCQEFLFSYDATTLFNNIPPQETIDIAINLIFNHNTNLKITRKELKKLFLFATSQTHFIFKSKFYNQIDRVAMGSPLAPVVLRSSWVFTYLSGLMNIILANLNFI